MYFHLPAKNFYRSGAFPPKSRTYKKTARKMRLRAVFTSPSLKKLSVTAQRCGVDLPSMSTETCVSLNEGTAAFSSPARSASMTSAPARANS